MGADVRWYVKHESQQLVLSLCVVDTYPQLRQMLEQVKYSSGKKLRVMRLSEISPQKRLLKAWRGNRAGG